MPFWLETPAQSSKQPSGRQVVCTAPSSGFPEEAIRAVPAAFISDDDIAVMGAAMAMPA